MSRANKIEKNLSAEQLQAFIGELAELSANPTLKQIQELAANYEITISHESARTFKRENFSDYISQLQNAKDRAALITQAIQGGEEGDVAAGAGLLLVEKITDFLMIDRENPMKAGEINQLALAINVLRSSDQAERKTKMDLAKKELELKKLRTQNDEVKAVAESKLTPEEKEAKYKEIFGIS